MIYRLLRTMLMKVSFKYKHRLVLAPQGMKGGKLCNKMRFGKKWGKSKSFVTQKNGKKANNKF